MTVAPAASARPTVALAVARWAALAVVIGAAATPPLVSFAAVTMVVAFFVLPDWRARLRGLRGQPLMRGWLVFVVALLLAALYGLLIGVRPMQTAWALIGWRHLLLLPIALAVFDEPHAQRRFAIGFVAFAVVAALLSLWALVVGFTKVEPYPAVILRNQVTQALTFAVAALAALALAAFDRGLAKRARWALGLAAAGLIAMLVFLQTGRSGFLAFVVAAVIMAPLSLRGRARLVALVVLPLTAVALYSASPRLQQRFALGLSEVRNAASLPEYSSMGIRVVIWQTTAELIEARPVFGYGLGGYASAYAGQIRQKYTEGWKSTTTLDPHNQYLFLWAEGGLVLLAAFGVFLVGAWRQRHGAPYGALGAGLLAAWCCTSLFSSHFQTFNEGHFIALFLGVFLARERIGLLQASAASTVARTSS